MPKHQLWMRHALTQARLALELNEVPVGAVVVHAGEIVGEGYNRTIIDRDPSAHAEIVALRAASARMGNHRLPASTMYVTLEPCAMCAGAVVQARLSALVYGASDPKSGAAGSVMDVLRHRALNHQCEVMGGVLHDECSELIQQFFQVRRIGPEC
ncbi:MAG: tRNA adenosine(34) deaminase TadA [Acidiferrobacterales bacterium]|nr:tRNA adenosine(34) deaminase TadA [Acidiferrobacterales bacterium]